MRSSLATDLTTETPAHTDAATPVVRLNRWRSRLAPLTVARGARQWARPLGRAAVGLAVASLFAACAGADPFFAGPECTPRPTADGGDGGEEPDSLRVLPPLPEGQFYCPAPDATRYPVG